jgi:hypothetical protein
VIGDAMDVAIHRPPGVGVRLEVKEEARLLRVDGAAMDPGAAWTWTSESFALVDRYYDISISGRATRVSVD